MASQNHITDGYNRATYIAAHPDLIDALMAVTREVEVAPETIRRGSHIKRRSAPYLWFPYVPLDVVTVAGEGNSGKTWLATHLAALVTRGETGQLPGDPKRSKKKGGRASSLTQPADVIFIQRENDEQTTLVPRFEDLGGDTARMVLPKEKFAFSSRSDSITDLDSYLRLAWYIEATGAKFVFIDPITGFLDVGKMSNAQEIRTVVERLQAIARLFGAAILYVIHLNKNYEAPVSKRIMESVEFYNTPRSAIIAFEDPDGRQHEDRGSEAETIADLVFYQEKNNLGQLGGAIGYSILGDIHPDPTLSDVRFEWRDVDQGRSSGSVAASNNGQENDAADRNRPGQVRDAMVKTLYAAEAPVYTTVLKDILAEEVGEFSPSTWARAVKDLPFKGYEVDPTNHELEKRDSGIWAWRPLGLVQNGVATPEKVPNEY